ncbi:CHASE2 domain-containing protein, partial [cf. Phormidesmis sp. LEGE 11477]|uniref:CHASE2 domain-containing protein n=1 Tax=cf. Phormidesmis sp. LEGE 11477 TaxID=1828680 RepID=UPI00187EC0F2
MGRQSKKFSRLVPGLIASGLVILLLSVQAWAPIERMVNNQVLRWQGAHGWDSRLVMISIDDKTIDRVRQFPISRNYYADLLEILSKTDAGKSNVVAFNLILSDSVVSDSPPPEFIPPTAEANKTSWMLGRSATVNMAEAMRQHGHVVLGQIWDAEGNAIEPAPVLADAAIAMGHLRIPFDRDGFTRSVEVFYQGLPALGMATVQAYSLASGTGHIPSNLNSFQINWPGPVSDLPTFSLIDVLEGAVPPDFLANKIIFVSYGATSGHTPVRSPFDYRWPVPGGYMHPAVVDNLLNRNWLRPIPMRIVLLLLLVGGPILSRVLFGRNQLVQLAIALATTSLWLLACMIALQVGYLLPLTSPAAVILGTYLFVAVWSRLQANALLQVRSAFLNTVSHEIRTPLNAIVNLSEMLQETPLDDRQREYAQTLHGSSRTLMALINDVLDLSKIESGHLTIEDYPVDLVEVIEGSIELLAPRAAAKNIELVYAIAPSVPALIESDPVRLQQILSNLLSNAVKFTAVGEVSVRVYATRCHQSHSDRLWRRWLPNIASNLPDWLPT